MGWIIVYVISGIVTFLCVIIQFPMVIVVFVSGNLLEYYKDMKDPDTGRYSKIFFAVLIPWFLESVFFLIVFPFQLFMTIMICITCIQFKKLMFDLGWCHKRKKLRNNDKNALIDFMENNGDKFNTKKKEPIFKLYGALMYLELKKTPDFINANSIGRSRLRQTAQHAVLKRLEKIICNRTN